MAPRRQTSQDGDGLLAETSEFFHPGEDPFTKQHRFSRSIEEAADAAIQAALLRDYGSSSVVAAPQARPLDRPSLTRSSQSQLLTAGDARSSFAAMQGSHNHFHHPHQQQQQLQHSATFTSSPFRATSSSRALAAAAAAMAPHTSPSTPSGARMMRAGSSYLHAPQSFPVGGSYPGVDTGVDTELTVTTAAPSYTSTWSLPGTSRHISSRSLNQAGLQQLMAMAAAEAVKVPANMSRLGSRGLSQSLPPMSAPSSSRPSAAAAAAPHPSQSQHLQLSVDVLVPAAASAAAAGGRSSPSAVPATSPGRDVSRPTSPSWRHSASHLESLPGPRTGYVDPSAAGDDAASEAGSSRSSRADLQQVHLEEVNAPPRLQPPAAADDGGVGDQVFTASPVPAAAVRVHGPPAAAGGPDPGRAAAAQQAGNPAGFEGEVQRYLETAAAAVAAAAAVGGGARQAWDAPQQTHLPSPQWAPPGPAPPAVGVSGSGGVNFCAPAALELMPPPSLEQEASYASTMAGVDLRLLVGQLQLQVQHLQEVNDQLQEEVVASQAGLMEAQQHVAGARADAAEADAAAAEAAAQAAAAEKSRAALREQLEELNTKFKAQGHQLELAHRQQDARAQELRQRQEAGAAASREAAALEQQLAGAKDELLEARRELAAANRKSALASEEAQRLSDEVLALRREASGLQEAVRKGGVEVGDLKERLRATAGEQQARENDANSLAQQLQQMQAAREDTQQQALRLQQQLLSCQDQLQEAQGRESSLRQQLAAAEHDALLLRNQQEAAARARGAAAGAAAGLHQQRSYGAATPGGPGTFDWSNTALGYDNPPGRPGVSWSPGVTSYAPVTDRLDRDQLGRPQMGPAGPKLGMGEAGMGAPGDSYDRQQQQQYWASPGPAGTSRYSLTGPDSREPWTLPHSTKRGAARSLGWGDNAAVHLSFDGGRRQQQQQAGGSSAVGAMALRRARSTDPPWATSEPVQELPADHLHPGSYAAQQQQQQAYYSQQQLQGKGMYRPGYQEAGNDPAWSYGASSDPTHRQQQQQHYTGTGSMPRHGSQSNLNAPAGAAYGGYMGRQQQPSPGASRPPPLSLEQSWPPWQPPGQQAASPSAAAYVQQQGPPQPQQQQQQVGAYSPAAAGPGLSERGPYVYGEMQQQYEGQHSSSMAEPEWYPPGDGNAGVAYYPHQQQQQQQQAALVAGGDGGGEASPFGTDFTLQDLMGRTKQLEDHLMRICQERDELTSEAAKMPPGGGRTAAARARKQEVERRLEVLVRDISGTRLQLKRLLGK